MERTRIAALGEHIGETRSISGSISVRRDHGKLMFLVVRDRSGSVQAVIKSDAPAFEQAEQLREEWVVRMEGEVKARPENMRKDEQNGDIEFVITAITILSSARELPFAIDAELNLDTYLDHLPLTLRTQRSRDVFAVQETIIATFRDALREQDFTEYQAPALVGGDAEGGAAAFSVNYYNDKAAYLATSPQLYKQILVGVFERVFSTSKVFRGEKSATTRHLAEYTSLDFEMGFITDHTDIMRMTEHVYRRIVAAVAERHADVFARFGIDAPRAPENFPVLTLAQAQELLERDYGATDVVGEPDLEPEHERQLSAWAREHHDSDFVFVTHYPVAKRPFYTQEDPEQPGFTKSFDLLFRGLEVTTGGQRVHEYDALVAKMEARGLNPDTFAFYLEAFKYGLPPHGGVGNGLERITECMLGLHNIREATLFPRDMNRIDRRLSE